MRILLQRTFQGTEYTVGKMCVDDAYLCDTLEDVVRPTGEPKVYGQTAIPAGAYPLEYTYSPKFGRYMPLIDKVPNFTGVRVHSGNTAEDTDGCILVGENKIKGKVINSRAAFEKFLNVFLPALQRGEKVIIEVKNKEIAS